MDIKKLGTSMLIAVALMLAFMYFFRGGGGGGGGGATTAAYSIYEKVPTEPLPGANEGGATPTLNLLGGAGEKDNYRLAVRVNNVTAGIDSVQLNIKQYAADVKRTEPLTLFTAHEGQAKPFSTLGIHLILGNAAKELCYGTIRLKKADGTFETRPATEADTAEDIAAANAANILSSGFVWKVDNARTTPTDAVMYLTLEYANAPVARITKTFHLNPDTYDITITHTVENLTDQPLKVAIDQTAAPAMRRDDPQTDDRFFHAVALKSSPDPNKQYVDGTHGFNLTWGNLRKGTGTAGTVPVGGPTGQFFDFAKDPQLWVATSNRFFAAIVRPLPETGNGGSVTLSNEKTIPAPGHVASAAIDLMEAAKDKPADDAVIVRLTGRVLEVPAHGKVDEPLAVYLGPKSREILQGSLQAAPDSPAYAHALYQYSKLLQFNTCYLYSFCVVDWLVFGILWMLDIFKSTVAFGNYGVAIMILVIVVRAVLHPLTRASQVHMAKMSKQMRDVAPQMEAMKKKYADNKKKQSEEMMRIYRENNINPAGGIMGCLPMLIQMPIWVALYSGLRADIDLRHAPFIPGWMNDLASPDRLFPSGAAILGHPIFSLPLVGDIYGFNLLPILLTAVFYFQMKVTTASQPKAADEQQAQMQKMSQYMIFIFPLFLYNAPSGLNLYIFASTMGGLVDTYLVRKTLKKKGILAPSAALLPTKEDADIER